MELIINIISYKLIKISISSLFFYLLAVIVGGHTRCLYLDLFVIF